MFCILINLNIIFTIPTVILFIFLGTVRSAPFVIRKVFMEPFCESRLDVYPLSAGNSGRRQRVGALTGIGTRIECNAPLHYPSK